MKRLFDLCLTIPGLLFISPLLIILAVLTRIMIGTPVLFKQLRPGLHGKPFELYKFRTMTNERDRNGNLLPDGVRLTRFGRFLRSTSLDELPTLINVLKGEMTLVGPRPLLMEYLSRYTPEQSRRHEVLPGITGWAQIHGRNGISWEEKFQYDIWYVDNRSLWLDMTIFARTVFKVLRREGISQQGHATMEVFRGTRA